MKSYQFCNFIAICKDIAAQKRQDEKVNMSKITDVRFPVLTAASMKMTAFWDIATCSLVEVHPSVIGPTKITPGLTDSCIST
jgi:hypothetical protein